VSDGGDPGNGWKPLLDELERRQTRARAMGEPARDGGHRVTIGTWPERSASDPRELRNALLAGLDLLETRRARGARGA
jgi:hypothetical protein